MLSDYQLIQPEVKKDIETRFQDFLSKTQESQQYNISKIQSHRHNGTDATRVDFTDLENVNSYAALRTTRITSTQVKALKDTPVILVPGVGVPSLSTNLNSVIIVEGITAKLYYRGTAFTGANNLEFRYGTASGTKVTADMSTTFLNNTASVFCHVAGVTTELIMASSLPIIVCVPTANPGAGNSQLSFTVKYRIVTL